MDNLITIFLNLILIISGLGVFVHLVELVGRDKNKNIGSLIKVSVFFLITFILVLLIKIYFFFSIINLTNYMELKEVTVSHFFSYLK